MRYASKEKMKAGVLFVTARFVAILRLRKVRDGKRGLTADLLQSACQKCTARSLIC